MVFIRFDVPIAMPKTNSTLAVRHFNRFYTRQIGILDDHILQSPFSLTEARVLFELAAREQASPSDLVAELHIDAGYLSRILSRFRESKLVQAAPSPTDGRRRVLSLTASGREVFAELDAASNEEVQEVLDGLAPRDQTRLIGAMETVEQVLHGQPQGTVTLRHHQPGDMGWVVQRHGEIYWKEYGWDETFEALVAQICADFIRMLNPNRERCWIAETEGERLGCIFLVQNADDPQRMAQLRLLLVEPMARGLGIGGKLVHACTEFAREVGYEGITLWTNNVLHLARHLYEREGYRLVREGPHHSFGHDLVEQTWELML
ncbi:MAG TPA: helix-turn-helix domain-containing GNAT family N-acetyltransferase [Rhodothermales bacterium]|nr:helix-turn-helix domain-containing GNAT family N-acetyltransferase [Rhodothermales bacterium]